MRSVQLTRLALVIFGLALLASCAANGAPAAQAPAATSAGAAVPDAEM